MGFSYCEELEIHGALSSRHLPQYIMSRNAAYSSLFIVLPPYPFSLTQDETSVLSLPNHAALAWIDSKLCANPISKPLVLLPAKKFSTRVLSASLVKLEVQMVTIDPSIESPAGSLLANSSQFSCIQPNKASMPSGWDRKALIGKYISCSLTSPPRGRLRVCLMSSGSFARPKLRRAVLRSSLFLDVRYVSRTVLYYSN